MKTENCAVKIVNFRPQPKLNQTKLAFVVSVPIRSRFSFLFQWKTHIYNIAIIVLGIEQK